MIKITHHPQDHGQPQAPKGTNLAAFSQADLDWVAAELNDRPRKRLDFAKPIELIGPLLLQ